MIRFFRQVHIHDRLFYVLGAAVLLFAVSFVFPFLFSAAQAVLILTACTAIADGMLLFLNAGPVVAARRTQETWSLGDENKVRISIENKSSLRWRITVIDEVPEQFQKRDFGHMLELAGGETREIQYGLRPVQRGVYVFGRVNLMLVSVLSLLQRRMVAGEALEIAVYPSVPQMKKYELKALARISTQEGIKRLRRLGHSYEFEEVKAYVRGDDSRSINWKASGRTQQLMVNQYEDERAQQVYAVLDKSRSMKMPFDGMSLLDYAINTSLVITNIALKKSDKAGLLTFADKIQSYIKAERHTTQLHRILEALYAQREATAEANFEWLFHAARYLIKGRSLLFLYTNFESLYALERVLPILRRVNQLHLLVVVFFQNAETEDFTKKTVTDLTGIYAQTIARRFLEEKHKLVAELTRHGITCMLTRPEDLSIQTVNKYLELKSRRLI